MVSGESVKAIIKNAHEKIVTLALAFTGKSRLISRHAGEDVELKHRVQGKLKN